jgi:heme-degrading monooxygenase HmoA
MIICLIHWKIRKGMEAKFISAWQTTYTIKNREGLVGEYLSESKSKADFPFITWPIICDDAANERDCSHFINVAVWESADRFHAEIADKFNDTRPILEFEVERRRRVLLNPVQWRSGSSLLPNHDSLGVQ